MNVLEFVLVCAFAAYMLGARRYERLLARKWPRSRSAAFAAGLLSIAAALDVLDGPADRWFSAHMLQHMLLTLLAAPLVLFGAWHVLAMVTLPPASVRPFMRMLRFPLVRALLSPPVTWSALPAALWIAHFSPLYEAALENESVHRCEHALFFAAALLFWMPVIAVGPIPWRLDCGLRVAYLFAAMPLNALLSVALYSARHVLYPHYADASHSADALGDQQAGAALMWILGGFSMFAAMLTAVVSWARGERARPGLVSFAALLVFLFAATVSVRAADVPRPMQRSAEELYQSHCASCHGTVLQGSVNAPPLLGVSAADVDFYVSTGRMPLADPGVEPMRDRPYFTPSEIAALVSYVSTRSGGSKALPSAQVSSDIARGRRIFEGNCQACHGATGGGASVGYGWVAPPLLNASMHQVAEAVRIGPGVMPRYDEGSISKSDLAALLGYVNALQKAPQNIGGFSLGNVGPVAEGLLAWIVGMGTLIALLRFIGTSVHDAT